MGGVGALNPTRPSNGDTTTVFSLSAAGGGAGATEFSTPSNVQYPAGNGGSGGGGSWANYLTGGTGISGQGNNGGAGSSNSGATSAAGATGIVVVTYTPSTLKPRNYGFIIG